MRVKKEQHLKFVQFMDSLAKEYNTKTIGEILLVTQEFLKNYLQAINQKNKKGENNAIFGMNKKLQDIVKLKQETSTIRLIASSL